MDYLKNIALAAGMDLFGNQNIGHVYAADISLATKNRIIHSARASFLQFFRQIYQSKIHQLTVR
jgi:hypothetical protein